MYMENIILKKLLRAQKDEITGHTIYTHLAGQEKDPANQKVLSDMADEEMNHYQTLAKYTNQSPEADKLKVSVYQMFSCFPGITFAIKLMERSEDKSQTVYQELGQIYPEFIKIKEEEDVHENNLTAMIKESKLDYLSSVILGMNDALIELTGALAGFTFALQNSLIIAITGIITGIAASLSMASSQYLAMKAESNNTKAAKAAATTGIAYLITVILLIIPFVISDNVFVAMIITLSIATIIIGIFTFYYSVVKEVNFTKKFLEMLSLSFGIAAFSFIVGYILKKTTGI